MAFQILNCKLTPCPALGRQFQLNAAVERSVEEENETRSSNYRTNAGGLLPRKPLSPAEFDSIVA